MKITKQQFFSALIKSGYFLCFQDIICEYFHHNTTYRVIAVNRSDDYFSLEEIEELFLKTGDEQEDVKAFLTVACMTSEVQKSIAEGRSQCMGYNPFTDSYNDLSITHHKSLKS
jgi:hypothetical protein